MDYPSLAAMLVSSFGRARAHARVDALAYWTDDERAALHRAIDAVGEA